MRLCAGVNLQRTNIATLHTSPYCTMPQSRFQSGCVRLSVHHRLSPPSKNPLHVLFRRSVTSANCDANANFNQGCGAESADGFSYGALFNSVGGGYYVMSRMPDDGIKVWFWRRDDPDVPPAVTQKGLFNDVFGDRPVLIVPDPTWGPPSAYFPFGDFCEYSSHFDAHIMVFDLTFCVRRLFFLFLGVVSLLFLLTIHLRATGLARTLLRQAAGSAATTVSRCSHISLVWVLILHVQS